MPIPSWIENELDVNRVSYRVHHHPTEYTAQAVARRERVPGIRFAKVVVAVIDKKPALLVMAADPAAFRQEAELRLTTEPTWTSPAVVGNRLYIRSRTQLSCFELTK